MQQGYLIAQVPDHEPRRVPIQGTLVVGRAVDCGLTIEDPAASRRHLEVSQRSDGFFWKDLGSTNGTLMNGRLMLEGRLQPGDRMEIGKTTLVFEAADRPEAPAKKEGTTLFRGTIITERGEAKKAETAGKTADMLQAVYTVMNEIATNYDVCSLCDRILETTVQAVRAQRGAVFFAPLGLPDVAPCPSCGRYHVITDGRLEHLDRESIQISNTVARRVLQDGESVLYQDTDNEQELNAAMSIMSLNLRSIICVPLRSKQDIQGILYLDTNRQDEQYTQEDLLLTTAVGNSAGLALENARMHTQMLEKLRIDQEIEYAWTIQQGFLVKQWPDGAGRFQVYGETRPAKTVGGDFYDVIEPRPGLVGILIGDVSGKGVPAALTMAQLLAEFRLCARRSEAPGDVVRALNETMAARSQRGMFCTLAYLTLELDTGQVRCVNAGHHAAVRFGVEPCELFAEPSGPPVGVLSFAAWEETTGLLKPGEGVLFYTDGIVEARSAGTLAGSAQAPLEYDTDHLITVVERHKQAPPEALILRINEDVRQFCAPEAPHDDCTMIALRYLR